MLPYWLSNLWLSLTCPGVSLGLENEGWKRSIYCYIIDQLIWLFPPTLLPLRVAYSKTKNDMMIESNDIDSETFVKNVQSQQKLLGYLRLYKKLELNLEKIFQITGQVILIALVSSETRTSQGLLAVFAKKDLFGIPADVFIVLSISFSFLTFAFGQTNGIAGSRIYFPTSARLLIGCSALFCCFARVTVWVQYFSPCPGLWNLLRHYQG